MSSQVTSIFKRITSMEKELQQLKIEAYFNLPKKQRIAAPYSQEEIAAALRLTRNQIWQKRYAKKIKSIS